MRKQVMVRAWEIAKDAVRKFGGKASEFFRSALTIAWKEVKKSMNKMFLKKWIEAKISTEMNGGFCGEILCVEKETEKALYVVMEWCYSSDIEKIIRHWVPKTAVVTKKEIEDNNKEIEKRIEKGLSYNLTLLNFAKANNIKGVRKGMKTVTLLNKINECGLVAPTK